MYVLCAAEWSFRAIAYRFVHRRTSRFGSRFGSKRIFKNMVKLFDCKTQEKAPKSSDFGAFYGGQYRTRTCDPMHVKQDRPFSGRSCCKTFPYFQYVWAFRNPHLDSTSFQFTVVFLSYESGVSAVAGALLF